MTRLPLATMVWLDPGATTGLCVVGIKPTWLAGIGPPTWEGMRVAIKATWFGQVGQDARIWVDDHVEKIADKQRVVARPEKIDQRSAFHDVERYPQVYNEARLIDQCVDLLATWPRAAWGHESFQVRTIGVDLSPVRVSGAVTHAELRYGGGRTPYQQTASIAKTTATDPRLKMAGLYRPGVPHAVDAARHIAIFLRRARTDAWLRAEAWPNLYEP